MTKHISEDERLLLRITLETLREVEERTAKLRSAFFAEANDIEFIDYSAPFQKIVEYFAIPYQTQCYHRDPLSERYFDFLIGKISADEFIDSIADDIGYLRRCEAEIGDAAYIEMSDDKYFEMLRQRE